MVRASVLFWTGQCSLWKRILERVFISLEMLEVPSRLAVVNFNLFRKEQFCTYKRILGNSFHTFGQWSKL